MSNAARTEDMQHFDDVIHGLAFSTTVADQMLLRMAAESRKRQGRRQAPIHGPQSQGFGDLNDKSAWICRPMLSWMESHKLSGNPETPSALMYCLERTSATLQSPRYLSRRPQDLSNKTPK